MEPGLAAAFNTLADAFRYPAPGRLAALQRGVAGLPKGVASEAYAGFLSAVERLPLGEWEELHTATFELNPPAAPYVGYQMWGDSYERGGFMAKLKRAQAKVGVDTDGELPDHLTPVLRYLAAAPEPLPELFDVLDPALGRMKSALVAAEPDNPYGKLLQASQALCAGLKKGEKA